MVAGLPEVSFNRFLDGVDNGSGEWSYLLEMLWGGKEFLINPLPSFLSDIIDIMSDGETLEEWRYSRNLRRLSEEDIIRILEELADIHRWPRNKSR
jgi:hypothetical protein